MEKPTATGCSLPARHARRLELLAPDLDVAANGVDNMMMVAGSGDPQREVDVFEQMARSLGIRMSTGVGGFARPEIVG